ncbi:MAG: hypothetical protein AAB723_03735 [Patescibacteria group bacterium]
MANIFQDKIVKYLTIGLFLAALGLLAQSLFSAKTVLPPAVLSVGRLPQLSDAVLSVQNLSSLKVENLKPFAPAQAPEIVGRDKPFEPYPLNEEIATTTGTSTNATSSPPITPAISTNATSTP